MPYLRLIHTPCAGPPAPGFAADVFQSQQAWLALDVASHGRSCLAHRPAEDALEGQQAMLALDSSPGHWSAAVQASLVRRSPGYAIFPQQGLTLTCNRVPGPGPLAPTAAADALQSRQAVLVVGALPCHLCLAVQAPCVCSW